jgi:hypothetical protein
MNSGDLALMLPIIVPTVTMLVIGGIIAFVTYYRFRRRREVQETIRVAIEKGQELPTEFLETISSPKDRPKKDQDLRRGIVLIAVGVGIGAFGILIGEEDAMRPLMGIGSIPFLIGLALTALWVLRTRNDK